MNVKMKSYLVFSWWEYLITLFFLLLCFWISVFKTGGLHSKALKLLKENKVEMAQTYFKDSIEQDPFNPWLYLNLGLTYDLLKESEKALDSYRIVTSDFISSNKNFFKKHQASMFYSYFNQAELYSRLGRLDEALANYQTALEFNYRENMIKKNIEWLFKDQSKNQDKKNNQQDQKNKDKQNQKQEQNKNQDEQNKNQDKEDGQGEKEQKNKNQDQKDNNQDDNNTQSQPDSPESLSNKENLNKMGGQFKDSYEKAILEEVEKQENEMRLQFYENKHRQFNRDKTDKDW